MLLVLINEGLDSKSDMPMLALLSAILLTLNMFYLKGTAHNSNDNTHYSDICESTSEQNNASPCKITCFTCRKKN